MAQVVPAAAAVSPVVPHKALIDDAYAAVDVNAGQSIFINSAGKADLASANTNGKKQFAGVALKTVKAGEVLGYLIRGKCAGFDLSNVAFGGQVFQADTAGQLADAAGTTSIPVGKCVPNANLAGPQKLLFVDADMRNIY